MKIDENSENDQVNSKRRRTVDRTDGLVKVGGKGRDEVVKRGGKGPVRDKIVNDKELKLRTLRARVGKCILKLQWYKVGGV